MTVIAEIDRKGLRDFGLLMGGMLAALFGLLLPWLLEHGFPVWPWIAGGIFMAWGLLLPMTLRPVYRLWMRFGLLMNRITTPLILGAVFFLMIVPMGLVMRLIRGDRMARRLEPGASSYRVASTKLPSNHMEKPY